MSVSTVQPSFQPSEASSSSGYVGRQQGERAAYPKLIGQKDSSDSVNGVKALPFDQADAAADIGTAAPETAQFRTDRFDSGEIAQLFAAVKEGDPDAALSTLQALQSAAEQAVYGPGGASSAVPGVLRRDLQALLTAVSASNVTAARQALARLQSRLDV
jgi:hypothetical protein